MKHYSINEPTFVSISTYYKKYIFYALYSAKMLVYRAVYPSFFVFVFYTL